MGKLKKNKKDKSNKINELSNEEYIKSTLKKQKLDRVKPGELTPKPYDESRAKWGANNKIIDLYSKNATKDRDLKDKYALIFVILLIIQLVVVCVVFILVGANILKYDEIVLNIFVSGSLLEIFAIVRIIVKYLFNDNLSEPLKIILKSSNSDRLEIEKKDVKYEM